MEIRNAFSSKLNGSTS